MTDAMAGFVAPIGWALVHFLWQGLLVGLVAGGVLACLGNARPQARYAVACAALALCLALPLLTLGRAASDTAVATAAPVVVNLAAADEVALRVDLASAGWREQLQPQLPLIVAMWSLGAGLLALRMALGLAWVARAGAPGHGHANAAWQARLDALAERFELPRRVLLRVVGELDSPVAARIWKPVVLVPAALVARMPTDLLEALLAHELAHIKRHDYLVNLVQSAIEALLFYHPVVWWLSRRIRSERELIADDLAAQVLGEPRRLALALDHLAQFRAPTLLHLAPAAHGGNLMSRIQRLVRPRQQALNWKLALPLVGLSVACLSVFAQGTAPVAAHDPGVVRTVVDAAPASKVRTQGALRVGRGEGRNDDYALVAPGRDSAIQFSGHYDDLAGIQALRERTGGEFLWFRRDGRTYLIQDATLVAKARRAWLPTEPVSAEMEALGKQMEVHGKVMEELGRRMEATAAVSEPTTREMEALGARMEVLGAKMEPLAMRLADSDNDDERDRLSAEMDVLSRQMDEIGKRMSELGGQMDIAQAPMEALGREMDVAGKPMEALGRQMDVLGEQMEKLSHQADLEVRALIDQAVRDGKALPVEASARR